MSLDGSTLDVAGEEGNAEAFGRPGSSRGAGAYPRIRFVSLVENGTNVRLPCEKRLADGSYLSKIYPSEKDRRKKIKGIVVRAIDSRLEGVEDAEPINRLVTTILDPELAPAGELAALYHERWEIETALDEQKTHLRGSNGARVESTLIILRSKTPDLFRQEFHGPMMAHFAVRGLMHEAALKAEVDPDRLSFLHAVRVIRRKPAMASAIPPLGRGKSFIGQY